MESYNGYEYTIDQKREGKLKTQSLLLILLYVAFAGGLAGGLAAAKLVPIIAVVPVLLYILVLLTWRYVQVSYTYSVETGGFKLVKGYGAKLKAPQCEFRLKECSLIAPLAESEAALADFAAETVYDARPSVGAPDAYLLLVTDKDGKKLAVKLQATSEALKTFKYYNSGTVVRETRV